MNWYPLMRPIVIAGNLNQSQLDKLRAQLGLSKRSRLDDSEDVDFGSCKLREGPGERVSLSLERDCALGWPDGYCASPIFKFNLEYEGERPSKKMVDGWLAQIFQSIKDAGLRVANEKRP